MARALNSNEMHEVSVNSWEEFEQQLKELRCREGDSASRLLFRGQEQSSWSLATTLERNDKAEMSFGQYYGFISKVRPQIECFTGNVWTIPEYPEVEALVKEFDEFSLGLSSGRMPAYSYMVHLRHHGFPSPLLDWSRSPYVAAYFAFSKADDKSDGKVAIYVFSEAAFKLGGNRMPFIHRFGPYVKTHRRHFLQQSEYTICFFFDTQWRFEQYDKVFSSNRQQQGNLWKFIIPSAQRLKVLKLFDEYNLNAHSLFDSEETLMETLALRVLHF
jgi:hypothetical protein